MMHAKPDLRVFLKWMIAGSGSVITDVIHLNMNPNWPFDDPPNVSCITTVDVLERNAVITDVYHDYGGGWQFLNASDEPFTSADGRIVSLGCMIEMDATITHLSELDYGWRASRNSPASEWKTEKNHPFPTFADSGFYIENADWISQYLDDVNPPPMEQRENLLINHWCKLIFRFRDEMSERENYDSERMWLEITDVGDYDFYSGILQNTPAKNLGLNAGDEIRFHPTQIIEIRYGG